MASVFHRHCFLCSQSALALLPPPPFSIDAAFSVHNLHRRCFHHHCLPSSLLPGVALPLSLQYRALKFQALIVSIEASIRLCIMKMKILTQKSEQLTTCAHDHLHLVNYRPSDVRT